MGEADLARADGDVEQAADEKREHQPEARRDEQRGHGGDELAFVRQQVAEEARGLAQGFLVDGHFRRRAVIGNGGGDGIGHMAGQ